ncbi:hypothetical protein IJX73_00845 [bacterium]|nr:hypothetical protein [bacterium]MBQ9149456.1 hypothetical protein [bacterium]
MEYITNKEEKHKKLSKEEESFIASRISSDFKTYDNARSENLSIASRLMSDIFFKRDLSKETDKNKKWKSKVKMCKLFMYFQTFKAFIWKNTYSGINSMFDVSGESLQSDTNANKQKAMLVDILEKMEYSHICDSVIDYALLYGELISFTTWKTRKEEYRRPINFFETFFKDDVKNLPKILEAKAKGKNFYIDEKTIYDNPFVIPVNPADFVFDVSQVEDFDNCPKIYRTWRTPEDIINNECYSITKEVADELRKMISLEPNLADISNQSKEALKDKNSNSSTIEVLEHWGNFTLPNGQVLKNWHAVVAGGKFLVRFEKNNFVINPFTFGTFIQDPQTKRGISPLASVLDLAHIQEELLNKTVNLQSLTENPPLLCPKDFFDEDEIELYPGKIITYDPQLYNSSSIQPLSFQTNVFITDITFLSDLMSEVSGIFPNMVGAEEKGDKTATEISVKAQGQTTRLSMVLDIINQYFIVPNIKNIAKLCANFKFGSENVFLNKDNNPENVVITDEIRQAEYRYTYSDRNATTERFSFADMVILAVERFANYIPLDVPSIFTWYMEQKGVENPERFLKSVEEIPLDVQQILLEYPEIQQMIEESKQTKKVDSIPISQRKTPENELESLSKSGVMA